MNTSNLNMEIRWLLLQRRIPRTFTDFAVGTADRPMVDFEQAATKAAPAVVHIKTLTKAKKLVGDPNQRNNPLREFFGMTWACSTSA
jgi:hypothetical protein